MYRIAFIDEEEVDVDAFKDYIESKDQNEEFEVIDLLPERSLALMLDKINDLYVDAIVTDYFLNEKKVQIKYNVPYDGVELVSKIQEEREDFPCFVITSYDDDAINDSEDVNLVYVKGILHNPALEVKSKARASFFDRLKKQILHYKTRIEKAEKRVLELIEKSGTDAGLDASEETELIEKDRFLERALDKPSSLPERLRKKEESESLKKLLDAVDELSQELRKDK